MKAVGVEEVFTLFVAFDSTLGAADSLPSYSPQQSLALVAVSWRRGCPQHEIVRRRGRDGVDQRLQSLLVNVHFLSRIRNAILVDETNEIENIKKSLQSYKFRHLARTAKNVCGTP